MKLRVTFVQGKYIEIDHCVPAYRSIDLVLTNEMINDILSFLQLNYSYDKWNQNAPEVASCEVLLDDIDIAMQQDHFETMKCRYAKLVCWDGTEFEVGQE